MDCIHCKAFFQTILMQVCLVIKFRLKVYRKKTWLQRLVPEKCWQNREKKSS